jgi:hypothetical protein
MTPSAPARPFASLDLEDGGKQEEKLNHCKHEGTDTAARWYSPTIRGGGRYPFRSGWILGDGSAVYCCFAGNLDFASGASAFAA